MFKHSVKVPRLYKVAAKVAKDVHEGVGSIKQLVYDSKSKHPNIKAIYALVATLYQRNDEIESLLKRSQLLVKEPRSDPWLTKIFIVELLWGKKCLPGHSKPEKTVLAYEQIFKAHMSDVAVAQLKNDVGNQEDLKPRYVRVNTLRMGFNEAVDGFRDEGWVLSKFLDKNDYKGFLEKITGLGDEEFLVDIHIPHLLIFPPKTQFYNHPAYKNGSIILQDKASCLPVHILAPPPGSVVLDMCSAPGMKTTQVAAAINNEGKVYAVERDPRRFETLIRIVEASGATCITTVNKDVLTCTNKDFPGVQYILVDPSCSGSGIVGRHGYDQAKSNERIDKLAGFQIKILRSALTRYPDVKRVVYSTCSVHPEENEDVVRQVLETNSTFKLVPATKFVNNTWKNFGSSEYGDIGSYCLYAKPNEDFTNGFFVAVFERLEEGEQNQFFNTKIYNFKKHVQSQEKRRRKQKDNTDNFGNNVSQDDHNESKGNIMIKQEPSNTVENGGLIRKKKKNNSGINIANSSSNDENNRATDSFIKEEKKRKCDTVDSIPKIVIITNDTITKQEKEEVGNVSIKKEFSKLGKRKYKDKDKNSEDNMTMIENESSDNVNSVRNDSIQKKNKKHDVSEDTGEVIKREKRVKSNTENTNIVYGEIIKEEKEELENNIKKEETPESGKRRKKKNRKDLSDDVIIIENNSDHPIEQIDQIRKKNKDINVNADYNNFTKLQNVQDGDVVKKEKKGKCKIENDTMENSNFVHARTIKEEKEVQNQTKNDEFLESGKARKKKNSKKLSEDVTIIDSNNDTLENNQIRKKKKKNINKNADYKNSVEHIVKKEKKRKSKGTEESTENEEQGGFDYEPKKEESPEYSKQKKKKNTYLSEDNVTVIEIESNDCIENNSTRKRKKRNSLNKEVESSLSLKFEKNENDGHIIKKEKKRKSNIADEVAEDNSKHTRIKREKI